MAFKSAKSELNTTPDGRLACMYGVDWLAHFAPPIGTGLGCLWCAAGGDQ